MGGPYVWVVIAIGVVALASAVLYLVRQSDTIRAIAMTCATITFASGLLGTILGAKLAYHTAATADPTRKATLLAEGISAAMNCSALAIGALILWIPIFVIAEVSFRRRAREQGSGHADLDA